MKQLKALFNFVADNQVILAFGVIYAVLFFLLPPQLMFINKWVGGGDLGSHQLPAYVMQKEIFPGFFGWTNRWYFGMPLFTFYFPIPFYFIAALAFLIPLAIAFKIGVMLGIYALPLAVYFFAKKINLKSPINAAIFSIFPLVLASNIITGGSINSTFAGEFTHLWAIDLMLVGLGFLYQKRKPILVGLLFALATLSHSLATVFLTVALPIWFLLAERTRKTFFYYLKVLASAFVFAAFWLIPFFIYRQYSSDLGYPSGKELVNYLYQDKILWGAFLLAAFADWRQKNLRFLALLALSGIGLWLFLPSMGIWLPRFLAFYYLFLFLLASQSFLLVNLAKEKYLQLGIAVILLLFGLKINNNNATIGANYRFAMNPPELAPAVNSLIQDLHVLPHSGRIINEYSDAVNDFWSPRGMELLPMFVPQNYTNGLYLESALMTAPAYLLQAEISVHKEQVGNYFQALPQTEIKPENAYKHLRFLGVNYLIANENNQFFQSHPEEYQFYKTYDKDHNLYQVKNPDRLITLAPKKPVVLTEKMSRVEREKMMIQWLLDNNFETPLVLSEKPVADWPTVKNYEEYKSLLAPNTPNSQNTPTTPPAAQITNKTITLDNLTPNQPYYLRVSYFPAWRSKDAEVYLTAPGMMLVVPHQSRVELNYHPLGW